MSWKTPTGLRLSSKLETEHRRMLNEWFFKWHYIGGTNVVEIDSFDGRFIRYAGLKFSGTARSVYWDAIQRYLRLKLIEILGGLETEIQAYPVTTRREALSEAEVLLKGFAQSIRNAAKEKDRVLRGDGSKFPPLEDLGQWSGSTPADIASAIKSLRDIHCVQTVSVEGVDMPLQSLANDRVTLVKKDGTVVRRDIPANVSSSQITMFVSDLPIEVGDHFLRELPSGLVDDFIVKDPGFHRGIAGAIPPHFQTKIKRSDQPVADPQTIINNITGSNARIYNNSVDNSLNVTVGSSDELFRNLRDAIAQNVKLLQDHERLTNMVAEMERAKGTPAFLQRYTAFINAAAAHMTIVAPFIPGLTALIAGSS